MEKLLENKYTFGYDIENIELSDDVKFSYAHWKHPYCSRYKFQKETVENVRKCISKGDVVIDIGAFTGDTSVLYGLATGKEGVVLAFEANEYSHKILQKNSELNKDVMNVIPINKAVVEKDGTYTFHYSDDGFCNGGFAEKTEHGIGVTGHKVPLEVQGINLENWIDKNCPDYLDKITFIKMDCEGYDKDILKSMNGLLKKIRPVIESELYTGLSDNEILEFFDVVDSIGYVMFEQVGNRDCSDLGQKIYKNTIVDFFHEKIKSGDDVVLIPKENI